jgi:hypothetical protein
MRAWFMSKFDNISLIFLILVVLGVLVWIDKHGNSDFEKWLETLATGFAGGYLGLVTGSRQKWAGSSNGGDAATTAPTTNGGTNAT